uniref:Uncharacterized protein n=1 Tax=Strongyloides papillosus TaxID=174720 RepID=A0A0N5BAL9_STREA
MMKLDVKNSVNERAAADSTISDSQNNEEVLGSEEQMNFEPNPEEHNNNVQISENNAIDILISEEKYVQKAKGDIRDSETLYLYENTVQAPLLSSTIIAITGNEIAEPTSSRRT